MRVLMLASEPNGGSRFYRLQEPAVAAAAYGVEVRVEDEADVEAVQYFDGSVSVLDADTDGWDLVVIQRPLHQRMHALAECLVRKGVPFVIDIDDDFHNVHPRNVAARSVDPRRDPLHNKKWLVESARLATLLTVSTSPLLKYARPGRAVVARNCVPERIFDLPRPVARPYSIGWTGTVQTHPTDLQTTRGALRSNNLEFVVVGDRAGVAGALRIEEQRVLGVPWTDTVERYWEAITDTIGIGIVPLEISQFNRAKSHLKGLEFAALGVPFVATPIGEYGPRGPIASTGLRASTSSEWEAALNVLRTVEMPDAIAAAGLAWARTQTVESNIGQWIAAWERATQTARSIGTMIT